MKKQFFAAVTALGCMAAAFSSVTASAEQFYFPYEQPLYRGFIVETDGTELTEDMLPFAEDYYFMSLSTWGEFTDAYSWGYNEIEYTPGGLTYIVNMRQLDADSLSSYARQLMLELDCVENAYLFGYTQYGVGAVQWDMDGQFQATMKNPDVMLEDLDIPELEGCFFNRYEQEDGTVTYTFGQNGTDSQLYLTAEAYITETYGTVEGMYMSSSQYIYEYLDAIASTLETNYSEYFESVEVYFTFLEGVTAVPSEITSAVSVWNSAGDQNADGTVDAADAADVLAVAAQVGAGAAAPEDVVTSVCDVNADGAADAADAAAILQYAAALGSGREVSWMDILR